LVVLFEYLKMHGTTNHKSLFYSFLKGVKKDNIEILDSPSEKHTGNDIACWFTGTKHNRRRSFSVHDGVKCEGCV
jgi:hypothetical protein